MCIRDRVFPADKPRHPLFAQVNPGEHVYFVHSFHATQCQEAVIAQTEYGAMLPAAAVSYTHLDVYKRQHLMRASVKKTGEEREIFILVATSGDTGKAALAGFCNVPGTRVMVFYPEGGVSRAQRLQMVTQEGVNMDAVSYPHLDVYKRQG